jgi:hypothetical protein
MSMGIEHGYIEALGSQTYLVAILQEFDHSHGFKEVYAMSDGSYIKPEDSCIEIIVHISSLSKSFLSSPPRQVFIYYTSKC